MKSLFENWRGYMSEAKDSDSVSKAVIIKEDGALLLLRSAEEKFPFFIKSSYLSSISGKTKKECEDILLELGYGHAYGSEWVKSHTYSEIPFSDIQTYFENLA